MTGLNGPHAGAPRSSPVVVVGGGVAGLICAIELHRAGRPVVVLERAASVGGRVRSSHVDGFTLDHGFQVLFTAYPTLMRYLNPTALQLRPFQPAAHIVRQGRAALVGDAIADATLLWSTLTTGVLPLTDKLRLALLRRHAQRLSIDACFAPVYAEQSTRDFLAARGFSRATIDGFFAPFYGGIFLDRSLSTSAAILLFTFKMLAAGSTAVPARGMGALADQLATLLPKGAVRVGIGVRRIDRRDGQVSGVTLDDGTRFEASDVVLATDATAAAILAETAGVTLLVPPGVVGCTTLYYRTTQSPLPGKALWLNAAANATVSHAVTLTDVAPEYADGVAPDDPRGASLLAVTGVGDAALLEDGRLDAAARREIAQMAAAGGVAATAPLHLLGVWRVPYAQFAQPAGASLRFTPGTGLPGLWRASEVLHSSSLEGAARGGQAAAQAILAS